MKIELTNVFLSKKQALEQGSYNARVCYTKQDWKDIIKEPNNDTIRRINQTLHNRHHSVYGHTNYELYFKDIPKFLAMILNNEKVYVTSEKSARYTKMNLTVKEDKLYHKWMNIFNKQIKNEYPKLIDSYISKLSQENARYLISVFTPTQMKHTLSFRQLNYVTHMMNNFVEQKHNSFFNIMLVPYLEEFISEIKKFDLFEERLSPLPIKKLSLFSERNIDEVPEYFGETYSMNYQGSLAQLAQTQRHRVLDYRINEIVDYPSEFFVPPIIKENKQLVNEWLRDMQKVSKLFPQGSLVQVNERGKYEDFIMKCYERICGHVQLETMNQTRDNLIKYYTNVSDDFVKKKLETLIHGPRCTFPEYACTDSCAFGKNSLERLI